MNVEELNYRAIISIVREKGPFVITYDDHVTNEIQFRHNTENCVCRIIAPIRFTIEGQHTDDMNQVHNYLHDNTMGFITVTKDWAAVCFMDPDEMRTYTVHDPINLRR